MKFNLESFIQSWAQAFIDSHDLSLFSFHFYNIIYIQAFFFYYLITALLFIQIALPFITHTLKHVSNELMYFNNTSSALNTFIDVKYVNYDVQLW